MDKIPYFLYQRPDKMLNAPVNNAGAFNAIIGFLDVIYNKFPCLPYTLWVTPRLFS